MEPCFGYDKNQTDSCHNWEGLHTCMLPKGHGGEHICGENDHRWADETLRRLRRFNCEDMLL